MNGNANGSSIARSARSKPAASRHHIAKSSTAAHTDVKSVRTTAKTRCAPYQHLHNHQSVEITLHIRRKLRYKPKSIWRGHLQRLNNKFTLWKMDVMTVTPIHRTYHGRTKGTPTSMKEDAGMSLDKTLTEVLGTHRTQPGCHQSNDNDVTHGTGSTTSKPRSSVVTDVTHVGTDLDNICPQLRTTMMTLTRIRPTNDRKSGTTGYGDEKS